MSAAPEYEELHALVDRLNPDQARRVLRVVNEELAHDEPYPKRAVRRELSFVGVINSGDPNLAERAEEIIRENIGRDGFGV